MKRLQDKVALVTGAADGIGSEIARGFAEESAIVVMVDRDLAKLQTKSSILQSRGFSIFPIRCDIGSTEEVKQAVQAVLAQLGHVDVLVNNAAIAVPGDITEDSDSEWNHLLNINLLGAFRFIKFVLPGMISRGSGSIINVGSLQGDRSWDHWTTYAAAKGGIKAMTRQLAGQYGPRGVRVNCITPGAMRTAIFEARRKREGGEAFEKMLCRQHALGRMGEADEINGAAIFLASDESAFVTGTDLVADGGISVLSRD